MEKVYWALVADVPEQDQWTVDAPIAKLNKFRYGVALPGREARTAFRVIAAGKGATLIEAHPFTGRTHQIRSISPTAACRSSAMPPTAATMPPA